ncbi:MAG: PQQ-binding-like beta-propeller repeat protein [Pirellulaceae bacterium]|nr:PQQ-binding-like beta-propeller repeat protein [Pirellulaceae bacterium]
MRIPTWINRQNSAIAAFALLLLWMFLVLLNSSAVESRWDNLVAGAAALGPDRGAADPAPAQPQVQVGRVEVEPAEVDTAGDPSPPDAPAVPATPLVPPGDPPWDESFGEAALPFQQVAYRQFDTKLRLPQIEGLKQWFGDATFSPPVQWKTVKTAHGQTPFFTGVMGLRWQWPESGSLRIRFDSISRLKMHFYDGEQGCTFAYYPAENARWAAYQNRRLNGSARPLRMVLTGTDGQRALRTNYAKGGPIDIRHHAGEMILSRGPVELLRAPLKGPPSQVFFDGAAAIAGVEMVRVADAPPARLARETLIDIRDCGQIPWRSNLKADAQIAELPDGAIELQSANVAARGWVDTPLPIDGPHEVVLELEDASPGVGVFFGRRDEKNEFSAVAEVVRFVRSARTGELCVQQRSDDSLEVDLGETDQRVSPNTGVRVWLRMVYGCGTLRWWISVDGQHWAEPFAPSVNLAPGIESLGLTIAPKTTECRVRLKRVQWRSLETLGLNLPADLIARAHSEPTAPAYASWRAAALSRQPNGVNAEDWLAACAYKTLGRGPHRLLGNELVHRLLDRLFEQRVDSSTLFAAIDEAALLLDVQSSAPDAKRLIDRYYQVSAAHPRDDSAGLLAVMQRVFESPAVTTQAFEVVNDERIRRWALAMNYRSNWMRTLTLGERLNFYHLKTSSPLLPWLEATARRHARIRGTATQAQKPTWRPLLVEELSKEVFNLQSELHAALDGDAMRDAARIIVSISPDVLTGVAPSAKDSQWLTSIPAAVRYAADQSPELRTMLTDEFRDIAELRIRRAVATSNEEAVRLAAFQFQHVPASRDAQVWLGDAALVRGEFDQALYRYEQAAQWRADDALAARMRMAAALLGRDLGEPAKAEVAIGQSKWSAADFEKMVGELKQRGVQLAPPTTPPPPELAPVAWTGEVKAKLDGAIGQSPQTEVTRDLNKRFIDWANRQLATVVAGDHLIVTNRFQVAAYQTADGKRLWQSEPPPGRKPMRSRDWALTAMRPIVRHDAIYSRQLYGAGPAIVRSNRADGKHVWVTNETPNHFFISDPHWTHLGLATLTLTRGDQNESNIELLFSDPDTGEPLQSRHLVRVRERWWQRRYCTTTQLEDGLIVSLSGVIFRCDWQGRLLWLRRQDAIPADEDTSWVNQLFHPPVVRGDQVWFCQPGVKAITCLNIHSGAYVWSRLAPSMRGVLDLVENQLLVRTDEGVASLEADTGTEQWRFDEPNLLETFGRGANHLLVARHTPSADTKAKSAELLTLDTKTGTLQSATRLDPLTDGDPRLGPIVFTGKTIWTFFGRGANDATRDLVALTPGAESRVAVAPQPVWLQLPTDQREFAYAKVPQWELWSAAPRAANQPHVVEVHGQKDVLALQTTPQAPIVWARRLALPAGAKGNFRLQWGDDPNQTWTVQLKRGGEVLWEQKVDAKTHPERWKTQETEVEGDGKSAWYTVQLIPGGNYTSYWQSLEIVF